MPSTSSLSIPISTPAPSALLQLLALSSDLAAVTDRAGRVQWVNDRFAAVTGHTLAQARGRPLLDFLGDAEAIGEPQRRLADAFARGQPCTDLELQHRRGDGSPMRSRLTMQPLLPSPAGNEGAGGCIVLLHEIDDADRLKQENARLRTMLEMAQEVGELGFWERDTNTGAAHWDANMFRFFGLDASASPPSFEEMVRHVHPDDRALSPSKVSLQQPGRHRSAYRLVGANGAVRHVRSVWQILPGPDGRAELGTGILADDTASWTLAQSYDEATSQLRLAADAGNIAMWRHDLKSNRMFYTQRAFDMMGIAPRPEGLPMEEVRALIHSDDLQRVIDSAAQSLESSAPVTVEARYRRSDGSWRHIHTTRSVQYNPAGEPIAFIGVSLDMTDQVATVRRSIELARTLDLATAATGVGIWSRTVDGAETHWNEQEFLIHGLVPGGEPPSGETYLRRLVHPDDQRMVEAQWRRVLDGEATSRDTEHRIVRPDGGQRWVHVRYRVDRSSPVPVIFGITLDTTERHASLAALREAHERAAFAARGAGIGTWELSPGDPNAIWDDQMYRLRGREPSEGPTDHQQRLALLHPDDAVVVRRTREAAARTHSPAAYEFRVRWPDGNYRWLASRTIYLFDDRSQTSRQLGVNWDITDAKTADAARQEKMLALRESQAKSEFLARMSHELRTPLNAVLGFTQLLQAEEDGASPTRIARLRHIRDGGEHLLSLINEVLDLSSLESGQMKLDLKPMPVAEVLNEALPFVQQLARTKDVTLDIGRVEGAALVDRTRLRQILINLLTNAIKYNRPDGRVKVRTTMLGARLVLSVSDTGRGMTRDQLEHLFEPFNRLGIEREGVEGTGIGLVIVKMLIERMGGEIEVRSKTGVGSVFELRLKTPEAGTEVPVFTQEAAPQPAPSLAPLRKGTVLYIEDNPVNTLLVQELILHREDLALVCEADGGSGAARAAELLPDLVLLDMQLPDMDGFEVLRRLRASPGTAKIPCIALSANAMPADIDRALAAGFSDYWTKPIDVNGFMRSLDALFARSTGTPSRF